MAARMRRARLITFSRDNPALAGINAHIDSVLDRRAMLKALDNVDYAP